MEKGGPSEFPATYPSLGSSSHDGAGEAPAQAKSKDLGTPKEVQEQVDTEAGRSTTNVTTSAASNCGGGSAAVESTAADATAASGAAATAAAPSSASASASASGSSSGDGLDKAAAFSLFQRLQTHVKKDTTVKKKRRKRKSRALKTQRQQEVIEALAGFASSSSGNSLVSSSKESSNASGNSFQNFSGFAGGKTAIGSDMSLRVAAAAAAAAEKDEEGDSSESSDAQRQAAQAMMARLQLYENHDGARRDKHRRKKQSAKRAEDIEQAVLNLQVEQLNSGFIVPSFDGSSLNSIQERHDEEEHAAMVDAAVRNVEAGMRRGRRR